MIGTVTKTTKYNLFHTFKSQFCVQRSTWWYCDKSIDQMIWVVPKEYVAPLILRQITHIVFNEGCKLVVVGSDVWIRSDCFHWTQPESTPRQYQCTQHTNVSTLQQVHLNSDVLSMAKKLRHEIYNQSWSKSGTSIFVLALNHHINNLNQVR
jgi:hypothetical protein